MAASKLSAAAAEAEICLALTSRMPLDAVTALPPAWVTSAWSVSLPATNESYTLAGTIVPLPVYGLKASPPTKLTLNGPKVPTLPAVTSNEYMPFAIWTMSLLPPDAERVILAEVTPLMNLAVMLLAVTLVTGSPVVGCRRGPTHNVAAVDCLILPRSCVVCRPPAPVLAWFEKEPTTARTDCESTVPATTTAKVLPFAKKLLSALMLMVTRLKPVRDATFAVRVEPVLLLLVVPSL